MVNLRHSCRKFQWCDGRTSNDRQTELPRPVSFPNGRYIIEIDELQKLAADNMALAELAAKRAADARRKTMQQKEVVGELNRNTMSDVAETSTTIRIS